MKSRITAVLVAGLLTSNFSTPAAVRQSRATPVTQAVTYDNLVSFFKATGLRTTEVQKRCTVFFEGEWSHPNNYDYCLIIVENSDEDIQVTFYLTDAHEMNWVTELLDAPFFSPAETRNLFGLINSDRNVTQQRIGRYRVDYHKWEPRHAQILVFSFSRG